MFRSNRETVAFGDAGVSARGARSPSFRKIQLWHLDSTRKTQGSFCGRLRAFAAKNIIGEVPSQ
jgi:hypothetical protein